MHGPVGESGQQSLHARGSVGSPEAEGVSYAGPWLVLKYDGQPMIGYRLSSREPRLSQGLITYFEGARERYGP